MKRRKKHDHVNHERWLVSYADFITLLFAFFVVMYAISQQDLTKLRKVSESLRNSFKASQFQDGRAPVPGLEGEQSLDPFKGLQSSSNSSVSKAQTPQLFAGIKARLEDQVFLQAGQAGMASPHVSIDARGLTIRIAAQDFFSVGSKEAHIDLHPLLLKIGKVLEQFPQQQFEIVGHTDPDEKHPDRWALSSARASWLADYWLERLSISPQQITVAGRAGFAPIDAVEGSQDEVNAKWQNGSNRRVEIIVLPSDFNSVKQ